MKIDEKIFFLNELISYRDKFLAHKQTITDKENSIKTYKRCLNGFIKFCYESNEIPSFDAIDKKCITGYLEWLDGVYREKQENKPFEKIKKLSNLTKIAHIATLKFFFRYISPNQSEALRIENVLSEYKFKANNNGKQIDIYMNENERKAILSQAERELIKNPERKNKKEYRNSLLVKLVLKSGLRLNEALPLKFCDFQDSDEKEFYAVSIKKKENEYEKICIAKSIAEEDFEILSTFYNPEDYIFSSGKGDKPMAVESGYNILNKAYQKCGIDNIRSRKKKDKEINNIQGSQGKTA